MRAPSYTREDDTVVELPWKWDICCACGGHGASSAYLGAYTQSEMDEAGPEFHDDYMRGVYDRACDACDGDGKVKVIDEARAKPDDLAAYYDERRVDRELAAEERAERAFGC